MKKTISILTVMVCFALLAMTGCKENAVKKPIDINGRFIGVYTDKQGVKRVGEVLRVVKDQIKIDSATGKKSIVSETLVGYWTMRPATDGTGNVLKTTKGTDSLVGAWQLVGLDSVNFKVDGIPIGTLLKK